MTAADMRDAQHAFLMDMGYDATAEVVRAQTDAIIIAARQETDSALRADDTCASTGHKERWLESKIIVDALRAEIERLRALAEELMTMMDWVGTSGDFGDDGGEAAYRARLATPAPKPTPVTPEAR